MQASMNQDEKPMQTMQTMQPAPQAIMAVGVDPLNANNVPAGANGRDWSFGLFDCFEDVGTCCLSYWCPCVVFGQNKSRLEHLANSNTPHPSGGEGIGGDCCAYTALMACCGLQWIVQSSNRSRERGRYRIEGTSLGDCCASYWCTPCALTQEAREIELEEKARLMQK